MSPWKTFRTVFPSSSEGLAGHGESRSSCFLCRVESGKPYKGGRVGADRPAEPGALQPCVQESVLSQSATLRQAGTARYSDAPDAHHHPKFECHCPDERALRPVAFHAGVQADSRYVTATVATQRRNPSTAPADVERPASRATGASCACPPHRPREPRIFAAMIADLIGHAGFGDD